MGANQSLKAGYACVSGDLSVVDKQHLVTRNFLQRQVALQNETSATNNADDPEESIQSEQIGFKVTSYAEDNELGEPSCDMIDPAPFFIASFSGTTKDREMVAEAMRAAMTLTLDGSRGHTGQTEASAESHAREDLPPSPRLQAAALALEKAVCMRDSALVRQLVHADGAVVDQYSQEGLTALHVAAAQGLADMISVLVLLDASIDAKTLKSGDTALHISASAGGLNDAARYECLEMLMGLGASLDLPNKDGRVPLHVAAMSGNLKAVQKLVAAGARQASPDKDGLSPVFLAEACGAKEVYQFLSHLDTKVQLSKIKQYQQWL